MTSEYICKLCDRDNREYRGRTLVVFDELNVEAMRDVLENGIQPFRCVHCQNPLDLVPTVVHLCNEAREAWLVHGRPRLNPETIPNLPPQIRFHPLSGEEDLQKRIRVGQAQKLARLMVRSWERSWETLGATVFASVLVLVSPDSRSVYAVKQARVWWHLLDAWSRKNSRRLEDDLRTHFAKGIVVEDTGQRALKEVDRLLGETAKHKDWRHYVFLAFRAAICAVEGLENDMAPEWAQMFFALELAAEQESTQESLQRLRISTGRASETIPYDVAFAEVKALLLRNPDAKALVKATVKIGQPDLIEAVLRTTIELLKGRSLSRESVLDLIDENKSSDFHLAVYLVMQFVEKWIKAANIDDLDWVTGELLSIYGNDLESRAKILGWFGSVCNRLLQPNRFFARAGRSPEPWEELLLPYTLSSLWTERSSHHRLLGELDQALHFILEAIRRFPADAPPRDFRVALRNEAVIRRDMGETDRAIAQLQDLVTQADDGEERMEMLYSLMTSYILFEKFAEALDACEKMVAIASGPFADRRPLARVARAYVRALARHDDEAITELRDLGTAFADPNTLFMVAAAWGSLRAIPETDTAPAFTAFNKAREAAAEAKKTGHILGYVKALMILAHIADHWNLPEAEKLHDEAIAAAGKSNLPVEPALLANKALYRMLDGDPEGAREAMLMMPAATAQWTGMSNDVVAVSIGRTRSLKDRLDALADLVIPSEDTINGRIVAEIKRDVVGRSQQIRQYASPEAVERLMDALSNRSFAPLVTPGRLTIVLEFVQGNSELRALATLIDEQGNASTVWVDAPAVSLEIVGTQTSERALSLGDPFAFPEWKEVERWLTDVLARIASPDAHLIFIDHEHHRGLPWHFAARSYTASYARSWSSLLLYDRSADAVPPRIGVMMVPRRSDSPVLIDALAQSVARTEVWAAKRSIPFVTEAPAQMDANAVQRIMSDATHAKLLCHGLLDAAGYDVALAIASNGELPPPASLVEQDPLLIHEFGIGWRDFAAFQRAPAIVFSAACSSGVSYAAGSGERVGLWAGLQHAGTHTLVASRWPLFPAVLPVLDLAFELMIDNHLGTADAVHRASQRFSSQLPLWQAWSLAVEGEWR